MPTNTTTPEAATTTTPATNTNTTPLSAMTGEEVASILVGLIRQNDGVLIQQKVTDGINQSDKLNSADTKMTSVLTKLQTIIDAKIINNASLEGYTFVEDFTPTVNSLVDSRDKIKEIHINSDRWYGTSNGGSGSYYGLSNLKVLENTGYIIVNGNYAFPFGGINDSVEEIYLDNAQISGYNFNYSFGSLKKLSLLNSANVCQNFLAIAPNCIDLIIGAGFASNVTNLRIWNPTNALLTNKNNLVPSDVLTEHPTWKNKDYLLYNIRRHFAANLQDRSQEETHYAITFSANMYAAINGDSTTLAAFTSRGWNIGSA